jgi:hypothetical protein
MLRASTPNVTTPISDPAIRPASALPMFCASLAASAM